MLSVIRLVDRVIPSAAGPEAPDEMPPLPAQFTLLLAMKSGGARGRYTVHLTMEGPSGERTPTGKIGGSGRPDPKAVLDGETLYLLTSKS